MPITVKTEFPSPPQQETVSDKSNKRAASNGHVHMRSSPHPVDVHRSRHHHRHRHQHTTLQRPLSRSSNNSLATFTNGVSIVTDIAPSNLDGQPSKRQRTDNSIKLPISVSATPPVAVATSNGHAVVSTSGASASANTSRPNRLIVAESLFKSVNTSVKRAEGTTSISRSTHLIGKIL